MAADARSVLVLFPDTNLFEQCPALESLSWRDLAHVDEIHLVVCRPIQRQIDRHKGGGNIRIAKRARAVSGRLREIIANHGMSTLIRERDPLVRLFIDSALRPDPTLAGSLGDYQDVDDALVGIVATYRRAHPDADARVFTHDMGPMGSAQSVGIPFLQIPDGWLLPPESSESDKRIAALERELARVTGAEPKFEIQCVDAHGKAIDSIDVEFTRHSPLPADQIALLMSRIKQLVPMARPATRPPKDGPLSVAFAGMRVPPTTEEIAGYEREYARWIERCEKLLKRWHQIADQHNSLPAFSFEAKNVGSRPGTASLLMVEAQGNFFIDYRRKPPGGASKLELPRPPTPPAGRHPFQTVRGTDFSALLRPPPTLAPIRYRDANEFYRRSEQKGIPGKRVEWECEQWRHETGSRRFKGGFRIGANQTGASGVLVCRIDAANLSTPVVKQVPVRISVRYDSAEESAKLAVEALQAPD